MPKLTERDWLCLAIVPGNCQHSLLIRSRALLSLLSWGPGRLPHLHGECMSRIGHWGSITNKPLGQAYRAWVVTAKRETTNNRNRDWRHPSAVEGFRCFSRGNRPSTGPYRDQSYILDKRNRVGIRFDSCKSRIDLGANPRYGVLGYALGGTERRACKQGRGTHVVAEKPPAWWLAGVVGMRSIGPLGSKVASDLS